MPQSCDPKFVPHSSHHKLDRFMSHSSVCILTDSDCIKEFCWQENWLIVNDSANATYHAIITSDTTVCSHLIQQDSDSTSSMLLRGPAFLASPCFLSMALLQNLRLNAVTLLAFVSVLLSSIISHSSVFLSKAMSTNSELRFNSSLIILFTSVDTSISLGPF